jgi:lon-related putative ATP-dependent protease
MTDLPALAPNQLYTPCDLSSDAFESTQALPDLSEFIGQARALAAVQFGIGMRHEGYNLFVVGPPGVGKRSLVTQFLGEQAQAQDTPCDWCYVNNFSEGHKPRALKLPPGRGAELRERVARMMEDLRTVLPAAFEAEQYRAKVDSLKEALQQREAQAIQALGDSAAVQGIALLHTPDGFAFAPMREENVLPPEEYEKLPDADKQRIDAQVEVLQEQLQTLLRQFPGWRREMRKQLRQLNHDTAQLATEHLIDELREDFADLPLVIDYLQAMQQDVVENATLFTKREGVPLDELDGELRRYQVNLLVDHRTTQGAPIVSDDHPAYGNLLGRVEHLAQMGALLTDFMLIKPGSLHRANGGYLLLDAHKLLTQPFAWEALKRALYAHEIRIESLGQMLSLVSTVSLEPEPIPLQVKVVLFGERLLYYLLQEFDPEFSEQFKVTAEFEEDLPRDPEANRLYARLVATLVRKQGLLPFARDGVARVIEHAARLADDAEKLTTHMASIDDLMRQADYWARQAGATQVDAAQVQLAIDAAEQRVSRLRQRVQEEMLRGTLLIDTAGAFTGQVNGLSVVELGNYAFSYPVRITATTRIGDGDVIDIEREVELGGAIHSKGVMILSSFLAARYARSHPLSLAASLVFEQSYGFVEGDSASLAELCALLSDLAQAPISQSLAVTGSVNQLGQVQAIGAVNHKIEGFFELCAARGLSGEQGVIIPAANVKHLMLKRAVVEAVAQGKFHIYAVETVDQAIHLLTGVPAGQPDARGQLPEGSINYLVAVQLVQLSMIRQSYAGVEKVRHRRNKKKPH